MIRVGTQSLRINGFSFMLFGFYTVYSSLLLALGKGLAGFFFRSLSARNLFHTCNSDSSSILGNQRHYVRPANR